MFGSVVDVEVDRELHRAVVRVDGIHVVHVVHAAHLLLDGRGYGLLDGLRIGAGIGRLNQDFRRNDLGECAIGSASIDTTPTMTMMIEITIATMGRLIKNLDMIYLPSLLLALGFPLLLLPSSCGPGLV